MINTNGHEHCKIDRAVHVVERYVQPPMTVQVLFVQGAGEDVHDRWDDKLAESLQRELGAGYHVRYPRMPNEADPRYSTWKPALLDELESLQDGSILVGHSIGGTMLMHLLAEEPLKLTPGAVCLIATPFIGEGGWPSDELHARTEFSAHLPVGVPIFLYHGGEDEIVPFAHVHLYAKAISRAAVRELASRDHQLNNDLREVARDIRAARRRDPAWGGALNGTE
jgi:predicted alpha/beta hydrolase family esterase